MDGDGSKQTSKDTEGKGKGKGKGKETQTPPDAASGPGQGDPGPSSLSRIAHSTASLLFSGPPEAGSGRGGNGKGESSHAAGKALARAAESSVQLRPTTTTSTTLPGAATVRTGQTEEHIAREEASFAAFLDSDSVPVLSGSGQSVLVGAWPDAVPESSAAARSVAEQEATDGTDVVALLSRGGDNLEQVFSTANEPASSAGLAGLREVQLGESVAEGTAAPLTFDNVLNFIPEYLRAPPAPGTKPGDDDLWMNMGATDAAVAWGAWLDQWSRVLTSYQDEVWGEVDLRSLITEAGTEVEQMRRAEPGERPPEPKALLRLRAILGHLRGA